MLSIVVFYNELFLACLVTWLRWSSTKRGSPSLKMLNTVSVNIVKNAVNGIRI